MKWYKRDPLAALEGMTELTLEEGGAYNIVIDLLYARDGNLPADDAFFAKALRCRPQVWRRVRDALIAKDKLHYKTDGKLTANRVETELQSAAKLIEKMSHLGTVSAEKRKQNKADTPTERKLQPQPQPQPHPEEEEKERVVALAAKRGSRLADDWQPSAEDLKDAGKIGLRLYEIDNEIPKFRDYWNARADKGAVKRDWSATWRNWCRKAIENNKPNGAHGNGSRKLQDDRLSVGEAAKRLAELPGLEPAPRPSLVSGTSAVDRRLLSKG